MNIVIEIIVGILGLFIVGLLIDVISVIFVMPITFLVAKIEQFFRHDSELLPIYNVFRIDHFINNFIVGLLTVVVTSFLLTLLPWEFQIRFLPVLLIAGFYFLGYNSDNGFFYEISIFGAKALGLIIGYIFI